MKRPAALYPPEKRGSMNTIILHDDNRAIYTAPGNVWEAFSDILEKIGAGPFENIHFDEYEGYIEYDCYDRHIKRIFNLNQGTPEIAADVLQWAFSMLDCIANS